jgi:hypothetical protein
MASEWYYTKSGQQQGPLGGGELKRLAAAGELAPSDLVWREGMADWKPAGDIKGLLFPGAQVAPANQPASDPSGVNIDTGSQPSDSSGGLGIDTSAATAQQGRSGFAINTDDGRSSSGGHTPSVSAARRGRRRNAPPIWKVVTLIGGALMLVAFATPWWSITVKKPKMKGGTFGSSDFEKQMKLLKKLADVMKDNEDWYEDSDLEDKMDDVKDDLDDDDKKVTVMLWGWEFVTGILALIFGVFIAIIAFVPMAVPQSREWSWIGMFVAAALGLTVVILSIVWISTCPNKNVAPILYQGFSAGPLLTLVGGLAALGAGVTDGIQGATALAKGGGGKRRGGRRRY